MNKAIIGQEIQKFIETFEVNYGMDEKKINFFQEKLTQYAELVFSGVINVESMEKENLKFIEDYKRNGLGGFNSTYGKIYHWLIEFASGILGLDSYDFYYGKIRSMG